MKYSVSTLSYPIQLNVIKMFIEEKFFITFVKYFLSIKNIQSANDQCDYQQLAVSL